MEIVYVNLFLEYKHSTFVALFCLLQGHLMPTYKHKLWYRGFEKVMTVEMQSFCIVHHYRWPSYYAIITMITLFIYSPSTWNTSTCTEIEFSPTVILYSTTTSLSIIKQQHHCLYSTTTSLSILNNNISVYTQQQHHFPCRKS